MVANSYLSCLQPNVLYFIVHFSIFAQTVEKTTAINIHQTHKIFWKNNTKTILPLPKALPIPTFRVPGVLPPELHGPVQVRPDLVVEFLQATLAHSVTHGRGASPYSDRYNPGVRDPVLPQVISLRCRYNPANYFSNFQVLLVLSPTTNRETIDWSYSGQLGYKSLWSRKISKNIGSKKMLTSACGFFRGLGMGEVSIFIWMIHAVKTSDILLLNEL